MNISFLDLRKRPAKLLDALERGEEIELSRRGTPIARIVPVESGRKYSAAEHPAFGMWADYPETEDVARKVREMRKGRFDAL
jgi:prevent-host-death family protein